LRFRGTAETEAPQIYSHNYSSVVGSFSPRPCSSPADPVRYVTVNRLLLCLCWRLGLL